MMPNMTVMAPKNGKELAEMLKFAMVEESGCHPLSERKKHGRDGKSLSPGRDGRSGSPFPGKRQRLLFWEWEV